jgi:hypothetical protein
MIWAACQSQIIEFVGDFKRLLWWFFGWACFSICRSSIKWKQNRSRAKIQKKNWVSFHFQWKKTKFGCSFSSFSSLDVLFSSLLNGFYNILNRNISSRRTSGHYQQYEILMRDYTKKKFAQYCKIKIPSINCH